MLLPYKFKDLNVNIDVLRLFNEIVGLGENPWIPHSFHKTGHDVIPLLSTNGDLYAYGGTPNNALVPPFLPTAHLEKMPYTKELIYSFGSTPQRVRIAKIGKGQIIKPHRDLHPNWYNKVRVHIPIVTNRNLLFHVWETSPILNQKDRTDFHMNTGTAWVFDTWRAHAVTNFSEDHRVHLIIDLEPRDKLYSLMFDGLAEKDIRHCLAFQYPREYRTDIDTLRWLTGGKIDTGIQLWRTTIVDVNPQISDYKYDEEFWR